MVIGTFDANSVASIGPLEVLRMIRMSSILRKLAGDSVQGNKVWRSAQINGVKSEYFRVTNNAGSEYPAPCVNTHFSLRWYSWSLE